MISIKFPDRFILTTDGVRNINDVVPGMKVYEWGTSRQLEIQELIKLPFRNMYKLTYSDERIEYITDREAIYLDQGVVSPHSPFCKCLKTRDFPIKLRPIDFTKYDGKIRLPLNPDPYVAGALLIHGDLDDPYMNWPQNRTEANNHFSHIYNVDYHSFKDGKTYFQMKGKTVEEPLKWSDFFGEFDGYIPSKYIYTEPYNRVQFIKGAFDLGYNIKKSPYKAALYHKDIEKINIVRNMLYTLGVSSIVYDDGDEHVLEMTGYPESWPWFYHYEYIVRMINSSRRRDFHELNGYDDESRLATVTLENIEKVACCERYWRNSVPHISLEQPNMIYISPNYLPRVSM